MNQKRILERGTHEELLAQKGRYYKPMAAPPKGRRVEDWGIKMSIDKSVRVPYNMAMITERNDKSISHAVLNMAEEYLAQERKTRYYGTDVPIYYAEIHALMMIALQPGIHVVGLAEKLEVNKASASELVIKLEKKGLVEKCVGEEKRSKLALYATDKGLLAHKNHMRYHELFDNTVEKQLAGVPPETRSTLLSFLQGLSKGIRELDVADAE